MLIFMTIYYLIILSPVALSIHAEAKPNCDGVNRFKQFVFVSSITNETLATILAGTRGITYLGPNVSPNNINIYAEPCAEDPNDNTIEPIESVCFHLEQPALPASTRIQNSMPYFVYGKNKAQSKPRAYNASETGIYNLSLTASSERGVRCNSAHSIVLGSYYFIQFSFEVESTTPPPETSSPSPSIPSLTTISPSSPTPPLGTPSPSHDQTTPTPTGDTSSDHSADDASDEANNVKTTFSDASYLTLILISFGIVAIGLAATMLRWIQKSNAQKEEVRVTSRSTNIDIALESITIEPGDEGFIIQN